MSRLDRDSIIRGTVEKLISSGDLRQVHQSCAPGVDGNWWGGSQREVRQLPQRD